MNNQRNDSATTFATVSSNDSKRKTNSNELEAKSFAQSSKKNNKEGEKETKYNKCNYIVASGFTAISILLIVFIALFAVEKSENNSLHNEIDTMTEQLNYYKNSATNLVKCTSDLKSCNTEYSLIKQNLSTIQTSYTECTKNLTDTSQDVQICATNLQDCTDTGLNFASYLNNCYESLINCNNQ